MSKNNRHVCHFQHFDMAANEVFGERESGQRRFYSRIVGSDGTVLLRNQVEDDDDISVDEYREMRIVALNRRKQKTPL